MPQTFLALVAVFILSTYALGQVRNSAAVAQHSVQREIEVAAADVARAHLASISERVFDEADAGQPTLRFTEAGLTTLANLGPDAGESTPAAYDDVDDFHQRSGVPTADSVDWDGGVLRFDVTISVRYVDPADPTMASAVPTLAKEIVVVVTEHHTGPLGRRPVVAHLRSVVSAAAQRSV
jgi:hypothetical protein